MPRFKNRCLTPGPAWLLFGALIMVGPGCDRYREFSDDVEVAPANENDLPEDHLHSAGAMGGVVSSLGRDAYHAEAVVQADGQLSVYILGADETRSHAVALQDLTAYVKPRASQTSTVFLLKAAPLTTDSDGTTSRFAGELPPSLLDHGGYLIVPGLRIDGERFTTRFEIPPPGGELRAP